jgi:hypothetical protein
MTDSLILDRLHTVMNDAGIDDHEIIGGVRLTPVGYQKLAAKMKVGFRDINGMINELITKVRDEQSLVAEAYSDLLDEDDERYSFEKDYLRNVTIHDKVTGQDTYLQGSEASEMLGLLASGMTDKQTILAQYADAEQPMNEDAGDVNDTFEPELEMDHGSYNFPWKVGNHHGTATVTYSGKGNIKLVSVRDTEGNEIPDVDQAESDLITQQAVAFIGDA